MIKKMYSVYDSKMTAFGPPFFEETDPAAIRIFSDAVNDKNPNNMWNKHPEDYSLFRVGEYDHSMGKVSACLLENLVTASALVAVAEGDKKVINIDQLREVGNK